MDRIIYEYPTRYGGAIDVFLTQGRYQNNDNLAIEMMSIEEDGMIEPYASITVNVDACDDWCESCVDTNNLGEDIVDWLIENEVAEDTGKVQYSGFCTYPVMLFNEDVVNEMEVMF